MVDIEKLCRLMKERDISSCEMARTVGISEAMMSYIRSGLKEPSLSVMVRIARRLGCTVDDLITSKA